jgi:hypothetical protein
MRHARDKAVPLIAIVSSVLRKATRTAHGHTTAMEDDDLAQVSLEMLLRNYWLMRCLSRSEKLASSNSNLKEEEVVGEAAAAEVVVDKKTDSRLPYGI